MEFPFYVHMNIPRAEVQEEFKLLDEVSSKLSKEVQSQFSEGDKAVTAEEWQRAADHYEKCIATLRGFEGLPSHGQHNGLVPDTDRIRQICTWARCSLIPIYHLELKLYGECIRNFDALLFNLACAWPSAPFAEFKWSRKVILYDWGNKLCEAGKEVEGLNQIQEALAPPFNFVFELSEHDIKCKLCATLSQLYLDKGLFGEAQRWYARAQKVLESVEDPGVKFRCEVEIKMRKAYLLEFNGEFQELRKVALELKLDLDSSGKEHYADGFALPRLKEVVADLLIKVHHRRSDRSGGEAVEEELVNLTEAKRQDPQYFERYRVVEENMDRGDYIRKSFPVKDGAALEYFEAAYNLMREDPILRLRFSADCLNRLVRCHLNLYSVDGDVKHLKLCELYLDEALALPNISPRMRAKLYFLMGGNDLFLHYYPPYQTGRKNSWGYVYYKKAAALNSRIFFDLENNVSDSWATIMEESWEHKYIFWRLQQGLFAELSMRYLDELELKPRAAVGIHAQNVLDDLNFTRPVCRAKSCMPASKELVRQALIWAERGRTGALMYQLGHGSVSQEARADLLKFDLDDKVAWSNIMESLSVCGRRAKLVEYSYETASYSILAYVVSEDGEVDMRSWDIGRNVLGEEWDYMLKEIYDVMSTIKKEVYFAKKDTIRRHLEVLFELFILPVADLLHPMHPDNKLVFVGNEGEPHIVSLCTDCSWNDSFLNQAFIWSLRTFVDLQP